MAIDDNLNDELINLPLKYQKLAEERDQTISGMTFDQERALKNAILETQDVLLKITNKFKNDDFLKDHEVLIYSDEKTDVFLTMQNDKSLGDIAVLNLIDSKGNKLTVTPANYFDEILPYNTENEDLLSLIIHSEVLLNNKYVDLKAELEKFYDELKEEKNMSRVDGRSDSKVFILPPEVDDLFEKNKKDGMTQEVEYSLEALKELVLEAAAPEDFGTMTPAEEERWSNSASALLKTMETIKVLEGALERNLHVDNPNDISIITKTLDGFDKIRDQVNGMYIDYIPDFYDFRIVTADGDNDLLLGEKFSYSKLFNFFMGEELLKIKDLYGDDDDLDVIE